MKFYWLIDGSKSTYYEVVAISPLVAYKAEWCMSQFLVFHREFPDALIFLNYSTKEEMFKATADLELMLLVSFHVMEEKAARAN